jgi:hypothetical protein
MARHDPDYELYEPRRSPTLYTCRGCGTIVHNIRIHDAWHRGIDERRRQAIEGDLTDDQ